MIDLVRLHEGDREYFTGLMAEYGAPTRWVTFQFATDDDHADDLFQEIWIHVWQRRKSYAGRSPFQGWLLVVARNVCRDRLRSETRRRRLDESKRPEPSSDPPSALDCVLMEERRNAVIAAVMDLPPRQRDALIFKLNDHLSTKEIAEVMGVRPVTVRSLVRKGILTLSRRFEDPR